MFNITEQVVGMIIIVNFITRAMEDSRVEVTAGSQTLSCSKNPKKHFSGKLIVATTMCNGNDSPKL